MGRKGRSPEALIEAQSLLVLSRRAADSEAIAFALTCNAWFCLQLGHADEGIDCAVEARTIYAQLASNWGMALSGAVYSWILLEMGLSDLGFEEARVALEIAERTDDLALRSFVMSCKGMSLMLCRQDQLAAPILEDALELADRAGDDCTIALNLINIAYSLSSQAEMADADGKPDMALLLRQRSATANDHAIMVARRYGDLWNLRVALCNGAEIYVLLDDIAQAQACLDEWEGLSGEIGLRERIHYLSTRGELLTHKGALDEALQICRQAVQLATDSPQVELKINTLRSLSDVEAAMGDFRSALEHYRAYHEVFVRQLGDLTRRRAQITEMHLQNERLRAQALRLEVEANQDALTGLPNRRSFELAFLASQGRLFSLAILDLDHFKLVNDQFSHIIGDTVLTRTGAMLLDWDDGIQPFRLGGEEFALLLPGVGVADAIAKLDSMREALAMLDWDEVSPGLSLTASFGVVDSTEFSGKAMMVEADRRLYAAKAAGRNRVVGRGGADGPWVASA